MSHPPAAPCRRIVLHLRADAGGQARLRLVAELARLLDIGIHGLFIEDEALLCLASLPFAREIRLPTFEWHKLDLAQMAEDLRQSAAQLRHRLDTAARAAGVPSSFETLPAPGGGLLTGDIVAADEAAPPRPGEAAAPGTGFTLLLPARPHGQGGPFAAVLGAGGEAVLDIACRCAVVAQDGLTLLSATNGEAMRAATAHAVARGVARGRIAQGWIRDRSAGAIIGAMAGRRQRLIVMPPPEAPGDAWQIVNALGVPVLLVADGG